MTWGQVSSCARRTLVTNTASPTDLDVNALELWDDLGEPTGLVDRARRLLLATDDAVRDGNPVVVFSKGGRLVDESGSRVLGHVRVAHDSVRSVLELSKGE